MKLMLTLILICLSSASVAGHVECFHHKKKIFQTDGEKLIIDKNFIVIIHKRYAHVLVRDSHNDTICTVSKF